MTFVKKDDNSFFLHNIFVAIIRDRLIETNGREIQARVEVALNRVHRPVTLRPSVSSINSCRHAGQLRLSVRIASARGRSRPSHRTKLTVMAMYFSVLDQVSTTVKWTSNTDVPIGVEPAPPRQHLTCYTSKPRYSFKPSILHPSIQTGWESAHPICLVVGKGAVTLVTLFCHGPSSLV